MTIDQSDPGPPDEPFATAPPSPDDLAVCRLRVEPRRVVRLEAETRRRIGRNLRLLYGDVLNQPLPPRFEELLAGLSDREQTGGSS